MNDDLNQPGVWPAVADYEGDAQRSRWWGGCLVLAAVIIALLAAGLLVWVGRP